MAGIFKRKPRGKAKRIQKWYADWTDHNGKRRFKCTNTTDAAAAQRIANKFEADAALRRDGVVNPSEDRYSDQAKRRISEHLEEFKAALIAKGNTAGHCDETHFKANRIIETCGARVVS